METVKMETSDHCDQPRSAEEKSAYDYITLVRNEFIGWFLVQATMSVIHNIVKRNQKIDLIISSMEEDIIVARVLAKGIKDLRNMQCLQKAQLQCSLLFTADWPTHKWKYGKQVASKDHDGTAVGGIPTGPDGKINVTSIGIDKPQYEHSPVLRRQVGMLEKYKDVDYFLWDSAGFMLPFAIRTTPVMKALLLRKKAIIPRERPRPNNTWVNVQKVQGLKLKIRRGTVEIKVMG
ncbi:hypothetical protein BKA93DRAFT_750119 [Sparassis latifolia]